MNKEMVKTKSIKNQAYTIYEET